MILPFLVLSLVACLEAPGSRAECGDEICGDHLDNDCDGRIDEDDAVDAPAWYADTDRDGYGDPSSSITSCTRSQGRVSDATDCDDTDANVHPDAVETCNHLDDDCDGQVDDGLPTQIWYSDADGDGWGDPAAAFTDCVQPSGTVSDATDCDDTDALVSPVGEDVWYDGVDSDCAGDSDYDADGDGYEADTAGGSDCDDQDPGLNPSVLDLNDEIDNNCDEIVDLVLLDATRIRILGPRDGAYAATSLAGGRDVNGDGVDDLFIGVPSDNTGNPEAGAAFVVYGPVTASSDLQSYGARLFSTVQDARAGTSVTLVGDTNKDGFDDLVVGGPGYDGGSDGKDGHGWFVLGPVTGDLSLMDADLTVLGTTGSALGTAVAAAGDVDKDGMDDWIVGAPRASVTGTADEGFVWLVFGNLHPEGTFTELAGLGATFTSSTGGAFGTGVAGAGDTDGDGYDDVLIGAPGADGADMDAGLAMLFSGATIRRDADLMETDALMLFKGEEGNAWVGQYVAGAGDVNQDGRADFLIGAPLVDNADQPNAGQAWLYFGRLAWDHVVLDGPDATFRGEAAQNWTGTVSAAGDVNDDTYDDILVGAPYADLSWSDAGATYLVLGPMSGEMSLADADVILAGEAATDQASVVARAGDPTGDGIDDILIGAPWYSVPGEGEHFGAAFLVAGRRW